MVAIRLFTLLCFVFSISLSVSESKVAESLNGLSLIQPHSLGTSPSYTLIISTSDQISISFGDGSGNQINAPWRLDDPSTKTYLNSASDSKVPATGFGRIVLILLGFIVATRNHCTWPILSLLSLQLFLIFILRSISFPHHHRSPSPTVSVSSNELLSTRILPQPDSESHQRCGSGRVFVYDMPKIFNQVILQQCDNLNPWSSRCDALSNNGFGKEVTSLKGVIPDDLLPSWFWTEPPLPHFRSGIGYGVLHTVLRWTRRRSISMV